MVTVGFVISKLRGVQIPANHNRRGGEAFDSPQDGKAAGSRWLPHSALSPPVSGWPGGWGPLTPHSTQGGLLEGTAHGGICSYLISLQVHLPFKTLPHQSSSKCSRKRDLVLHCHLPSSCQSYSHLVLHCHLPSSCQIYSHLKGGHGHSATASPGRCLQMTRAVSSAPTASTSALNNHDSAAKSILTAL